MLDWLCSLIALPKNKGRWINLYSDLVKTRRGITASLVAQTLFATIAYIFIIISSFDSELGDPITALQIASGSLWIWLVPVIWGWITVGTQSKKNSIENALVDNLAVQAQTGEDGKHSESLQLGIGVHPCKSHHTAGPSQRWRTRSI